MVSINPYLNFNGTTEAAFNFYKSVFGGEFIMLQRFKDTPEECKAPPEASEKIMHIALPIGKGNILMATDAIEPMSRPVTYGSNFYLSVSTESEAEADKIFNGLSAGGKVEMAMAKVFWGSYFGMFEDKFGVHWMVSFDSNHQNQS